MPRHPTSFINIEKLKEKAGSGKCGQSAVDKARRKLKILKRDNFKCVLCGSTEKLTIDHVDKELVKYNQYMSKGPSSFKLNACRILCIPCHIKKNEMSKMQRP